MINFKKNSTIIEIDDPILGERLATHISADTDLLKDVSFQVLMELEKSNLVDIQEGWLGTEPDVIACYIMVPIYPQRLSFLKDNQTLVEEDSDYQY